MTELKSCPFCGGEAKFHVSEYYDSVSVLVCCARCGASSDEEANPDDAASIWNIRTADRIADLHHAGMDASDDALDWRERALEAERVVNELRVELDKATGRLSQVKLGNTFLRRERNEALSSLDHWQQAAVEMEKERDEYMAQAVEFSEAAIFARTDRNLMSGFWKQMREERDRLRAAIDRYGLKHGPGCKSRFEPEYWNRCDCGLTELRAALSGEEE